MKTQENQIAYLLAPGGRTIMVEPHLVDQARLTLARERVVPGSGVGFMTYLPLRVSGKRNFSKTLNTGLPGRGTCPSDFDPGRVRPQSLISSPGKKPVCRKPGRNHRLGSLNLANKNISRDQVETVLHLVAGAVEGLSPRSVRITDQSETQRRYVDESASGNMDDNYAYKRRYEKNWPQES